MEVAGLDLLEAVVLLMMMLGVVGVLLPLVPGPLLVWLGALVYDLVRGITLRSGIVLAVMTILMVAGSTTELWMGSLGARRGGASGCALGVAVVAGVVGLIFFNIVGAILLPVVAVLVVELLRLRNPRRALRAGGGYLVGWLLSVGVELVVVLVMIGLWLWRVGGWQELAA